LHKKEEENLADTLSARYGIPYIDLSSHPINIDALRVIKEDEARAARSIAVFNITDKNLDVAVLLPRRMRLRPSSRAEVERGYMPSLYMVSHASLEKVWDRYKDLSYSFETKAWSA
jgi:hypothetical protein